MLNDPRDRGAYRIAIASLGLAVAVVLAGICWIAAIHVAKGKVYVLKTTVHVEKKDPVHKEKVKVSVEKDPARIEMGHVPAELWFVLGALGGVFVGALIPFSPRVRRPNQGCVCKPDVHKPDWWSLGVGIVLILICGALVIFGHSLRLQVIDTTVAGVLLGLLIPSPARTDP